MGWGLMLSSGGRLLKWARRDEGKVTRDGWEEEKLTLLGKEDSRVLHHARQFWDITRVVLENLVSERVSLTGL